MCSKWEDDDAKGQPIRDLYLNRIINWNKGAYSSHGLHPAEAVAEQLPWLWMSIRS